MQRNQKHADGQFEAAFYEVLCMVCAIEGKIGVFYCICGWHGQLRILTSCLASKPNGA